MEDIEDIEDMEDMEYVADIEGEEPGLDERMDVDRAEPVDAVDAPPPSAAAAAWVLPRGQRLNRGQKLSRALSSGSVAELRMQHDGNLVLYSFFGPRVRVCWESATQGGRFAEYQHDGNFVIYNAFGPIWASNTTGNDGASVSINAWGQVWVGFEALTNFCSE